MFIEEFFFQEDLNYSVKCMGLLYVATVDGDYNNNCSIWCP